MQMSRQVPRSHPVNLDLDACFTLDHPLAAHFDFPDIHLISLVGSIPIYLMSGQGSPPGGVHASIWRGPGFYFHFFMKKKTV